LYAWCLAAHFIGYPASVGIGFSPHFWWWPGLQVLLEPNVPVALIAWIGWTIFYGSFAVFIALVLLWSVFAFRVIPLEERQLRTMFGDDYLHYMRSVHRWIGRV